MRVQEASPLERLALLVRPPDNGRLAWLMAHPDPAPLRPSPTEELQCSVMMMWAASVSMPRWLTLNPPPSASPGKYAMPGWAASESPGPAPNQRGCEA